MPLLVKAHIERVSTRQDLAAPPAQVLTVTWWAMNPVDGQVWTVEQDTAVPDPTVFLTQADWDTNFGAAMATMATISGMTVPTVNPVVIP